MLIYAELKRIIEAKNLSGRTPDKADIESLTDIVNES